jgi:hypothetical protein
MSGAFQAIKANDVSVTIGALVDSEGTAAHPHVRALLKPLSPIRDLSDALHIISMLHARFPGILDHASTHGAAENIRPWIAQAAESFVVERQWLTSLVAAVGPLPSTPGHAECEAVVSAQCHALDTLAQSDRVGCAAGAAAAMLLDWRGVRDLLDIAGNRLGLDAEPYGLPDAARTEAAIDELAATPAIERAVMFGAQQFLAQQRGLWDLLESRAAARTAD